MLSAAHPGEEQRMAARTSQRTEQLVLPIALVDDLPAEPSTSSAMDGAAAPADSANGADAALDLTLEVRINRRLRTTYRWRIDGNRLLVERPVRASERELATMLTTIRDRAAAYLRRQTVRTDGALLARARRLLARYFPER